MLIGSYAYKPTSGLRFVAKGQDIGTRSVQRGAIHNGACFQQGKYARNCAGSQRSDRKGDIEMTTVYDTDEHGNVTVIFESKWRFPELLGYSPDDPQYAVLQRMWEKATGRKIEEGENHGKIGKAKIDQR